MCSRSGSHLAKKHTKHRLSTLACVNLRRHRHGFVLSLLPFVLRATAKRAERITQPFLRSRVDPDSRQLEYQLLQFCIQPQLWNFVSVGSNSGLVIGPKTENIMPNEGLMKACEHVLAGQRQVLP